MPSNQSVFLPDQNTAWSPVTRTSLVPPSMVDGRQGVDRRVGHQMYFLRSMVFAGSSDILRSPNRRIFKTRAVFENAYFGSLCAKTPLGVMPHWWSASSNGGVLESLGYKDGFRVDVDIPDSSWSLAPSFHDILILNTGHWWWAPSKFDPRSSPMLFFEKGLPVIPPKHPEVGLDMTLKHMTLFVETEMGDSALKFFRTQSPRHFEGGDWNEGGSCQRTAPLLQQQVEQLFSLENNGTNIDVRLSNEHMYRAVKGTSFKILDITRMSEYRADAHPSRSGGKKHDDCMHWCLPGITDSWNDMLVAHLNRA